MKKLLIIGGFFIIAFICLVPLRRDIAEYDTQKNGEIVVATIIDVPNCIGAKIRHQIKFMYDNEVFSKRIGAPCEQYKVGDSIRLKHTPGTNLFLYENETKEKEFISTGLLALAGITFIIIGFRRRKNST